MLRLALLLALILPAVLAAAEPAGARVDAEYRQRRQGALVAQWMEVKLPFETPAAYLTRLLDTARDGDSRATAALGWEFQQRGDKERAKSWLGRSAERQNPFAAYLLGVIDPPAEAPVAEGVMAIDWMRRAAEAGLPEAQFELALRHVQGRGARPDPSSARLWYTSAAAQNFIPALCNLATMEMQGVGGERNMQAAEEHFRAAAEEGYPQGHFGVAEVLRLQNRGAEAIAPYRLAAEQGVVEAHFWLGWMAATGVGQEKSEREAAKHFLKAALEGNVVAQAVTADILRRGAGTPTDPKTAAHWEEKVAKVEDPALITSIGSLFLEGKVVGRDLPRALAYLRRAAAAGNADAQRLAGTLLATGEAGERNLEEAYQWLWLAARNGRPEAEQAFQAVIRAMNGNQILEATRRADQFKPLAPQTP